MKLDLGNILLPMALALFTACTDTSTLGDHPEDETTPIAFGTDVTRAAVESTGDLKDFLVWGWHAGSTTALFNGETVHPDGSYDGGDRYWTLGQKHDFFALHPNDITATATCDKDGKLTVTNFDCSATGNEAIDLMTACALNITHTSATSIPAVPLTFSHELARVKFSVTSVEAVTLSKISLTGIAYKGNFTFTPATGNATWTDLVKIDNTTTNPPFHQANGGTVTGGETTPTVMLGGDLLLIPQAFAADETAKFSMTWTYADKTTSRTVEVPLYLVTPNKAWEKGKSYHFSAQIPGKDSEIKFTVEVSDWDNSDIHVDFEQSN